MLRKIVYGNLLLSLLLLGACAKKETPPPAPRLESLPLYVMAKVNEVNITKTDYDQKLQILSGPVTPREIIDLLIDEELIVQEALKEQPLPQGLNEVEALERKRTLGQRLAQEKKSTLFAKLEVREKDAQAYLKQNEPAQEVNLLRIVLSNQNKADSVASSLKQGTAFRELAEQFSLEPVNLGVVKKKEIEPGLEHIVFGLKEGECSSVIPAATGFYIYQRIPLSEDYVKNQVRLQKEQAAWQEWLNQLKRQARIILNQNYFG